MRSLGLGIVAVSLLGIVGGTQMHPQREDSVIAESPAVDGGVGIAHPVYALNPQDDRALVAYATDVFLGRVLEQTGTIGAPTSAPGQELPQTQFAVDVVRSVKGRATGVVTVNQVGGLDSPSQRGLLLEGDALLRAGTTELFLVVHVPEQGWYQIAAGGHGHLPADDPAHQEALVERFAAAAEVSWSDGIPARR